MRHIGNPMFQSPKFGWNGGIVDETSFGTPHPGRTWNQIGLLEQQQELRGLSQQISFP
jgi:hypothetical protein